MSNELTLIPETELKAVIALDNTVKESKRQMVEAEKSDSPMLKAMILARATTMVRNQLMPMMGDVLQLMGSPLGFRTDRDRGDEREKRGPYTKETVCDVVTVALLNGFQLVNNEFNIIASNFYGTKEGFARLLREMDGFKDWRTVIGVAQLVGDKGALVPMHSTWTMHGVHDEMKCEIIKDEKGQVTADRRIPVRVNAGQGADAINGKAESKLYRKIYKHITGSDVSSVEEVGDENETNTIDSTATVVDESQNSTEPAAATATTVPTAESQPADSGAQFRAEMDPTKNEAEARLVYDKWYGPDSSRESQPGEHERDQAYYQDHIGKIRAARDSHAAANAENAPVTGKASKGGKQRQGTLVS